MLDRLRLNWRGAPTGLRWWILTWMVLTLVLAILTFKVTSVGRLFFTAFLFYHLLDKGKTARGMTVAFCLMGAGFGFWHLSSAPLLMGALALYSLGFAGYLIFAPKYKFWINSIPAKSLPASE